MHVETFFDPNTSTFTHVVVDQNLQKCAVIDSVLDYDQDAAKVSTTSADQIIAYIGDKNLSNEWILETHIHADHLSAANYLQKEIGGKIAIGAGIKQVLALWVPIFDTAADTPITGEQFDCLFADGERFKIGELQAEVWHTPGHTPACSSYHIENAVFVGDTIFAPDSGTARVDFPGGSAKDLYHSIQRIYALPDETILYLCHDYPTAGHAPTSHATVGQQKQLNTMLNAHTTLEDYVAKRTARDRELNVPKLILPSIQTNMRLGDLGQPADNGIHYLKIPLNKL